MRFKKIMALIIATATYVATTVPIGPTYAEVTSLSYPNAHVRYQPAVKDSPMFPSDDTRVAKLWYRYRSIRFLCGAGTAPVTLRNGSYPLHGYNGQHGSHHENPDSVVER